MAVLYQSAACDAADENEIGTERKGRASDPAVGQIVTVPDGSSNGSQESIIDGAGCQLDSEPPPGIVKWFGPDDGCSPTTGILTVEHTLADAVTAVVRVTVHSSSGSVSVGELSWQADVDASAFDAPVDIAVPLDALIPAAEFAEAVFTPVDVRVDLLDSSGERLSSLRARPTFLERDGNGNLLRCTQVGARQRTEDILGPVAAFDDGVQEAVLEPILAGRSRAVFISFEPKEE